MFPILTWSSAYVCMISPGPALIWTWGGGLVGASSLISKAQQLSRGPRGGGGAFERSLPAPPLPWVLSATIKFYIWVWGGWPQADWQHIIVFSFHFFIFFYFSPLVDLFILSFQKDLLCFSFMREMGPGLTDIGVKGKKKRKEKEKKIPSPFFHAANMAIFHGRTGGSDFFSLSLRLWGSRILQFMIWFGLFIKRKGKKMPRAFFPFVLLSTFIYPPSFLSPQQYLWLVLCCKVIKSFPPTIKAIQTSHMIKFPPSPTHLEGLALLPAPSTQDRSVEGGINRRVKKNLRGRRLPQKRRMAQPNRCQ